ncbi:MAG: hypothetical protein ABSC50_07185 [Candidatus Bathyarchaeia archaeon]
MAKIQRLITLFLLLVAILSLFGSVALPAYSQTSNPTDLSYLAFRQLLLVYQSGGQASDLVARMNSALSMIEEAHNDRIQGNTADANRLENEAGSAIQDVLAAIPAAQGKAASDSANNVLTVVALVPLGILVSTLIFYATLRTWRSYERLKLYEMRIVEKKTEA